MQLFLGPQVGSTTAWNSRISIPHLPVPYIFGSPWVESIVTWYIGLPGSNRFQRYRELEDEGMLDNRILNYEAANEASLTQLAASDFRQLLLVVEYAIVPKTHLWNTPWPLHQQTSQKVLSCDQQVCGIAVWAKQKDAHQTHGTQKWRFGKWCSFSQRWFSECKNQKN